MADLVLVLVLAPVPVESCSFSGSSFSSSSSSSTLLFSFTRKRWKRSKGVDQRVLESLEDEEFRRVMTLTPTGDVDTHWRDCATKATQVSLFSLQRRSFFSFTF